jgi:valyl-tRNA synthetase
MALMGYPMQSRHISLSEKQFERMRNFCNKLWNASRFVRMNTDDLPGDGLAAIPEALQLEDRWILGALRRAILQADAALERFAFDEYLDTVYRFIWNAYCDWYVELVKDRLNAGADASGDRLSPASRRAAQVTLLVVLENTLRLLHPVAPFITEELWLTIREQWGAPFSGRGEGRRVALGAESIMIAAWPAPDAFADDPEAEAAIELIQQAIGAIRNIRGEMGVAPGDATAVELVTANAAKRATLQSGAHYLRGMVRIESLAIADAATLDGFTSANAIEDLTVQVQLPEKLVAQERQRLDKEIARLENGIEAVGKKLGSEKFIAGAPAEVVEKEREKMARLETEVAALRDKRAQLG